MKRKGVVILVLVLCITLTACGSGHRKNEVKVLSSATDYVGQRYETVIAELEQAGFSNIHANEVDDLTSDSSMIDGEVSEVSIDGNTNFIAETVFAPNSEVIVTYHIVKKINAPLSSTDIVNADIVEVGRLFEEAGFTNVEIGEVYDLDPDTFEGEFENKASINDQTSFSTEDTFAFDAKISIVCHRPYEKYDVTLKVECVGNWFFDKYDIDISIDGVKQATLDHGESDTYAYRVKEGAHTFTLSSADNVSIKQDITLDVYCNLEASYKITCHSDKVDVEELYMDRDELLSPNQVKIQFNRSEFVFKDYHDVEKTLKDYGFTNIKTVPVYDIIFGITSPGETDNVTINGIDTYRRGDVLEKDAEIVITYHMREEDDPANQPGSPPVSDNPSATTPSVTENPDEPVSYSTNTQEQAKKGNTGVFAYKKSGSSYDQYYIIDFDEGYVYYFTDGNGSETCERLKIDEGDLNSVIIVTYHDGGTIWQNGLHFKWKNQPETLILEDSDHFEYEFRTTNLNSALSLRNSKTIKDY